MPRPSKVRQYRSRNKTEDAPISGAFPSDSIPRLKNWRFLDGTTLRNTQRYVCVTILFSYIGDSHRLL